MTDRWPPGPSKRLSRRGLLRAAGGAAAFGALAGETAGSSFEDPEGPISLDAGFGETLRIEPDPFRLSIGDGDTERLATPAGNDGTPVRPPGADGPQPIEPAGAAGPLPAIGFVVGEDPGTSIRAGTFGGNRGAGVSAGGVVSVTTVDGVRETARGLQLRLGVDVPGAGPAHAIAIALPDGGVSFLVEAPADLPVHSTVVGLRSPSDEGLYGMGGTWDAVDLRGTLRNVWSEQQNATLPPFQDATAQDPTGTTGDRYLFPNGRQASHYPQAVLYGDRGWGVWVSDSELGRVDLAKSHDEAVRWETATDTLRVSFVGGGLENASRAYTAVGGSCPFEHPAEPKRWDSRAEAADPGGRADVPPEWVFTPWIDQLNNYGSYEYSDGQYYEQRVRSIAEKIEEHDLPVGVIGVEPWEPLRDAGGVDEQQLFDDLRAKGFQLSGYTQPWVKRGSERAREAAERGVLIEDAAGNPYLTYGWYGDCYQIDFTHPDALGFWKERVGEMIDYGFSAYMNDFGENVREDMQFHNGQPGEVMHNAYLTHYHRANEVAVTELAAESDRDFEPFFYHRGGFEAVGTTPGNAAYTPGVFPGDETRDWNEASGLPSVPRYMLNMAMGGVYAFTTDVAGYYFGDGYGAPQSAELFTRWTQLASLTAMSRVHSSPSSYTKYPWNYDDATLDAYRRYSELKVNLIPLVREWATRAAENGDIGPVRPLHVEFDDPEVRAIDDQWLLGRNVLVAPILEEGARQRPVYLPEGARWQQVAVDEDGTFEPLGPAQAGGRTVEAPAPLRDIPIFVRRGGPDPVAAPPVSAELR